MDELAPTMVACVELAPTMVESAFKMVELARTMVGWVDLVTQNG